MFSNWFEIWLIGPESLRAHLSPCVSFRYDTKLYTVVRRDSEHIPNNDQLMKASYVVHSSKISLNLITI